MARDVAKLKDKTGAELEAEVRDLREQLFKLRWQAAGGQLDNPSKIRLVRRDIARRLTIVQERREEGGAGGQE